MLLGLQEREREREWQNSFGVRSVQWCAFAPPPHPQLDPCSIWVRRRAGAPCKARRGLCSPAVMQRMYYDRLCPFRGCAVGMVLSACCLTRVQYCLSKGTQAFHRFWKLAACMCMKVVSAPCTRRRPAGCPARGGPPAHCLATQQTQPNRWTSHLSPHAPLSNARCHALHGARRLKAMANGVTVYGACWHAALLDTGAHPNVRPIRIMYRRPAHLRCARCPAAC